MLLETVARVALIGFLALTIISGLHKLRKNSARMSTPVVTNFVIAAVLLSIHTLVKVVTEDVSVWAYILGDVTQQYGALFGYIGTYQALNNKSYYSLSKSKALIFVTILSVVTTVTTLYNTNNLASFVDNESYVPSTTYYLSNASHYLVFLILSLMISVLYLRNLKTHQNPVYTVVRSLLLLGFLSISLALLIVEINLLVSIFITEVVQQHLNTIYHGLKLLFVVLLTPLLIAQPLISSVSQLITSYRTRRRQQTMRWLRYLHSALIRIVPQIQLNDAPDDDDLLIEIADAEEHILSHVPLPHNDYRTIARHIHTLLVEQVIVDKPGPHLPPPVKHPINHSIRIAKYLKRLEADHARGR
jgi:hypothetical protein